MAAPQKVAAKGDYQCTNILTRYSLTVAYEFINPRNLLGVSP